MSSKSSTRNNSSFLVFIIISSFLLHLSKRFLESGNPENRMSREIIFFSLSEIALRVLELNLAQYKKRNNPVSLNPICFISFLFLGQSF